MQPELREKTEHFLETGEAEDIEIGGHTVKGLVEDGMKELGAYLALEWLAREPEQAKQALESGWK